MSTTKKSTEQVPFLERPIVRTILPIAGFVIICVLFAILTDGRLFQPKNISLLLSQSYMLLISSIGVFMVMTMGGLDFSQGSMLGVASIVVCYLSHYNMVLAALGGVVTGGLIGLINGYFNVKRKITSFIVTICTMYLFRGVCAYATTNSPVYAVSDISKYNTLPFMLTFTVIIFVVAYLVFTYTGLGSRLKAIGAGETAARFAGIRVETTKILVFVAAGCITGLAAFVNAIKVGSVTSTAGNQLETQIMIALVLGGMPVNGGAKVRFYNIILGVMTYKVLSSGLVMLMMPTQLQQLILGVIFAIFLGKSTFGRRVYAIGTNRLTAYYSGVHVQKIRFVIYTLMGTISGLCAVFLVSSSYGANTTTGNGFEMDAIAMAVFGGISSTGGKGNLAGGIISAFIIVCLRVGLGQKNVNAQVILLIIGVLLVAAVALPNIIGDVKKAVAMKKN